MKHMDALFQYWAEPDYIIIDANKTDEIIAWLEQQTPETWHNVALTWNYDAGDRVMRWMLDQDTCDKGTAAQIFCVEGVGTWLGEAVAATDLAKDKEHLCQVALSRWDSYETGDFKPNYSVPEHVFSMIEEQADNPLFSGRPIKEILSFQGQRKAVSEFGSQDGMIVVDFDHWLGLKGITIDP